MRPAPAAAPAVEASPVASAAPTAPASATSSRLYRRYSLRRVYYSAFSPFPGSDPTLPPAAPPLVREHRLYQADWLMRFYGFTADELTPTGTEYLDLSIDPKLAWALAHPEAFPVDANRAPRERLLRVP
jgi:predicted DNA-binding helix-hairpin-helix protein